jgi:hypothetical protein
MAEEKSSEFGDKITWIFIGMTSFATLVSLIENILVWLATSRTADVCVKTSRMFFFVFFLLVFTSSILILYVKKRRNWARMLFIASLAVGILLQWAGTGGLFFLSRAGEGLPTGTIGFCAVTAFATTVIFGWIIRKMTAEETLKEFGG